MHIYIDIYIYSAYISMCNINVGICTAQQMIDKHPGSRKVSWKSSVSLRLYKQYCRFLIVLIYHYY